MPVRIDVSHCIKRDDGLLFDPDAGVLLAPPSRLRPQKKQARTIFDPQELKELRAEIDDWRKQGRGLSRTGFIDPLVCRWALGALDKHGNPKPTAMLDIADGERRWRVTHEDYPYIPIVLDTLDDEEMFDVSLRTSLTKKLLTPLEEGHAFKRRMDKHGESVEQAARHYNVGPGYARNRVDLLKTSEAAQRMVLHEPDTMTHALLLGDAKLPRDVEGAWKDDQPSGLIAEVLQGLTVAGLKQRIKEEKDGIAAAKAATSAPDRHTASRNKLREDDAGGQVGRGGELIRGVGRSEAQQTVKNNLANSERALANANHWADKCGKRWIYEEGNDLVERVRRQLEMLEKKLS